MFKRLIALILVAALLATGCAGPKPTPVPPTAAPTQPPAATAAPAATATPAATDTPAPTPEPTSPYAVTSPRSVEITALWFGTDDKGAPTGGTSKVTISVAPNSGNQFRVGFFEGEVGGSGPMWRASGWVATIMAALLTGFDPGKTQVSFDVGGRIDGPSAGGLMTIGVLAALRGETLREDAAMTGTINPDGTIGPVGGIPYKLEGAAKAGKKLVLIPIGRVEKGEDLIAKGQSLGLDVREVADIYTAYEALTGKPLPRPTVSSTRPQISGPIYDRMAAKGKEWLARYQQSLADYDALPDDLKLAELEEFVATANEAANRSERQLGQGLVGGAYAQAFQAALWATLAAHTGRSLEIYVNQGIDGVSKQLSSSAAFETKVSAIADRLKAEKPTTVAGAETLTSAYSVLIGALGLAATGGNWVQAAVDAETEEEAVTAIVVASLFTKMADLLVEQSKDLLDVAGQLGGAPLPADAPIANVADFFTRASEANLALFDTVVLEPVGQQNGLSLAAVQHNFAAADFTYAMTRSSLEVMPKVLEQYFGGGEASAYAKLGGALAAYSSSTGLIAKYYSLDAALDEGLNVVEFGRERALMDTLDLADEQARGSIALLVANGVDPSLSVINYESARLSREGGTDEKMEALTGFWDVYIHTRALAYLGGFAGK
jgi:uncharacterized protein